MTNTHNNTRPSEKSIRTTRVLILLGLLSTQACVAAIENPFKEEGTYLTWGDDKGIDSEAQKQIGIIEASKNSRATVTHTTYRAKIAQSIKDAIAAVMTPEDESEDIPQK